MNVLLATDVRLLNCNGKHYLSSAFGSILIRYADFFGPVTLVCREVTIDTVEDGYIDVDAYIKSVLSVKALSNASGSEFQSKLKEAVQQNDLVIVRAPSILSITATKIARKLGKPYLAEAMGDAWDANWNHSLAGKCIAPYMLLQMKKIFAKADFGLYVTSKFLQNRYPCPGLTEGISNVKIKTLSDDFLENRKSHIDAFAGKKVTLMTTAAVNVRFKGQEFVIRALSILKKQGIDAVYYLAGNGDQSYLRNIAKQEGVEDQVVFLGHLPLEEVISRLDGIDIYVQPSLQEGLPRSVIEAMSRGCACIGARTAGIPELLEDRFVVKRKSPEQIAEKIQMYLALDKQAQKAVAERNFTEAKNYEAEKLDRRRNAFFAEIIQRVSTAKAK